MGEAHELEVYELNHSDLTLLSSSNAAVSLPQQELQRLENIKAKVLESLGPTGPGLLAIVEPPNDALVLRRKLLSLSRNLALLPRLHRNRILKAHNLGSDVPLKDPERRVSSFAMQLNYSPLITVSGTCVGTDIVKEIDWEDEFGNLGVYFRELGYCMMELGLCMARLCDDAIGGHELERGLTECGTAKGRLIHYHSILDRFVLKEGGGKKGVGRNGREQKLEEERRKKVGNSIGDGLNGNADDFWQQWHYDYGIFTVLTAPMFFMENNLDNVDLGDQSSVLGDHECPYPNGHTYLQIFDPGKNKVMKVRTSSECFIVQVGEFADILSKGKLRATLHCVCRPEKLANLSRETFVVFLQPAWSKTFSLLDYPMGCSSLAGGLSNEGDNPAEDNLNAFGHELQKAVPPLFSRLKDGMTFAELSRETTKQYYGSRGLQSNN